MPTRPSATGQSQNDDDDALVPQGVRVLTRPGITYYRAPAAQLSAGAPPPTNDAQPAPAVPAPPSPQNQDSGPRSTQLHDPGAPIPRDSPMWITTAGREEYAFNYLLQYPGLHLEAFQVAAIVGNLLTESASTMSPTILYGSTHSLKMPTGVGYGIAQWTLSAAQDALRTFAQQAGLPIWNFGVQLAMVANELVTGGVLPDGRTIILPNTLTALRNSKTTAEATAVFEVGFENPISVREEPDYSSVVRLLGERGGATRLPLSPSSSFNARLRSAQAILSRYG